MASTTLDRTWYNTLVDDSGNNTDGSVWDKADVDSLMDAIDAVWAAGQAIDQGADDTPILQFRSTDVAHGVTTVVSTDTYGYLQKISGVSGGLLVGGLTEDLAAVQVTGVATNSETTKSAGARAPLVFTAQLKSGTGVTDIGANGNMMVFVNNATARFFLDADGDSHQDIGTAWTNFDNHDDLALIHAVAVELGRETVRPEFAQFLEYNRVALEAARIVTFNADGHHFINWSRFSMVMAGALRQLGSRLINLETRLDRLLHAAESAG